MALTNSCTVPNTQALRRASPRAGLRAAACRPQPRATTRRSAPLSGARATQTSSLAGLTTTLLPLPATAAQPLFDLSEGLETPVQLLYLGALVLLLSGGAFVVVRQVLLRRELEDASKTLGERARAGSASPEELFQLGAVLLRKKVYSQAIRHLETSLATWREDADSLDLKAQAHNALGYALVNTDKTDAAVEQYRAAVALQPGYVVALNNLGEALERRKQYAEALDVYEKALSFEPGNDIAGDRARFLRTRLGRTAGVK